MNCLKYRYSFDDLADGPTQVRIARPSGTENRIWVTAADSQLLNRRRQQFPAQLADCVDLALAVHTADRLSIRNPEEACEIQISLPVRHPEVLNASTVIKELHDTMHWFTDDDWSFEFLPRSARGRVSEIQMVLPFSREDALMTLWSGGLDSLAGVYTRLVADPSLHYVLVGSGASDRMLGRQREVAAELDRLIPGRIRLIQIPLHLSGTNALPKSSRQRSRGFVFMLLGAVCAYLEEQTDLQVYENGIGAINLAYRASEVGLSHTRSVHPLSLLRMSDLISRLFGQTFTTQNPFLSWTKAQMCETLAYMGQEALVYKTISCDHLYRSRPEQCGWCSSCLLRRQALAAVGLRDQTEYQATSWDHTEKPAQPDKSTHLRAMLRQVATLRTLLEADDPWLALVKHYPRLDDIIERTAGQGCANHVTREDLLQLYGHYSNEWDEPVRRVVGQGVLSEQGATARDIDSESRLKRGP